MTVGEWLKCNNITANFEGMQWLLAEKFDDVRELLEELLSEYIGTNTLMNKLGIPVAI